MEKKQIQACVDYINKNAAALHGVPKEKLDIGGDITAENIVEANVVGINAVVLADRGVKGTSKYVIALDDLEKGKPPVDAAEVEAKKVDAVKERVMPGR